MNFKKVLKVLKELSEYDIVAEEITLSQPYGDNMSSASSWEIFVVSHNSGVIGMMNSITKDGILKNDDWTADAKHIHIS